MTKLNSHTNLRTDFFIFFFPISLNFCRGMAHQSPRGSAPIYLGCEI
jgi:hypothetical protein